MEACAWIISTLDGSAWIEGGRVTPGERKYQRAYRSELAGQIGIAAMISNIILPPEVNPTLTVACARFSAL